MIAVQIIIAVATILSAWGIARYHIIETRKLNNENRKVNEEKAGKNRAFYDSVEVVVGAGMKESWEHLNKFLRTGDYTILSVIQDGGNSSKRIFTLGKIVP